MSEIAGSKASFEGNLAVKSRKLKMQSTSNVCMYFLLFFTGPYTTSKYADYVDYDERPSPSNSENADVSQNSLIKSTFHQNVLTPTVEVDSSSTRNPSIYSNSVTSTESLYNGYNRLRFITGG